MAHNDSLELPSTFSSRSVNSASSKKSLVRDHRCGKRVFRRSIEAHEMVFWLLERNENIDETTEDFSRVFACDGLEQACFLGRAMVEAGLIVPLFHATSKTRAIQHKLNLPDATGEIYWYKHRINEAMNIFALNWHSFEAFDAAAFQRESLPLYYRFVADASVLIEEGALCRA